MTGPVPLVGWDASDEEWHQARRGGCGASDVAALLGFSPYRSPWAVWAQKTGHPLASLDEESDATRLGHALEPWLLEQASHLAYPDSIWAAAVKPDCRTYAHPEQPWRLASLDGVLPMPHRHKADCAIVTTHHLTCTCGAYSRRNPPDLVELKTAGLTTGRAHGWTDTQIPLGYDLQVRWQMHVMDAQICHVVALVAGRGLCHYPITRDLDLEAQLVEQVTTWWERHIIGGDEPPLTGRDAAMVAALYPHPVRRSVQLDDTPALDWWQAYRDAHLDETEAKQRKAEAGTALKALIGDAEIGLVDGRPIATWAARKGRVDWEAIARELYGLLADAVAPDPIISAAALVLPKLEELADQRRTKDTRSFTVKE